MFCPRPARVSNLSLYNNLATTQNILVLWISWYLWLNQPVLSEASNSYLRWAEERQRWPEAAGTGSKAEEGEAFQARQANWRAGKPNSTRVRPCCRAAASSVNQSPLPAGSFLSEVLLEAKAWWIDSSSNLFRLKLEGDPHNGEDQLFTCLQGLPLPSKR